MHLDGFSASFLLTCRLQPEQAASQVQLGPNLCSSLHSIWLKGCIVMSAQIGYHEFADRDSPSEGLSMFAQKSSDGEPGLEVSKTGIQGSNLVI